MRHASEDGEDGVIRQDQHRATREKLDIQPIDRSRIIPLLNVIKPLLEELADDHDQ